MKILLLNGPNLNLLGSREPGIYGHLTLAELESQLRAQATTAGASFDCFQSNYEGALLERIGQTLTDATDFIIINPAAFTHTSIALRDALLAVKVPFIEVHLSNVHARESFRHHSFLADIAQGVICGLGPLGYHAALNFAIEYLKQKGK